MRNRHLARVCGVCHAPMARQEETCWRCGATWTTPEDAPRITSTPVALPVAVAPKKAA